MPTPITSRRTSARLSVAEIAGLSAVAPSAVRFYEKHGLIRSERTASNQRRFRMSDSCRLKVIRVAQRSGLTVAEIRELLAELPATGDPSIEDWYRVRGRLQNEVYRRMQQLEEMLVELRTEEKLCELAPVSRETHGLSAG
jgi:MerR family transcriptional regulator, redox-sensitive transcriptional activator SoxR